MFQNIPVPSQYLILAMGALILTVGGLWLYNRREKRRKHAIELMKLMNQWGLAWFGGLFVILIIFIFLRNIRSTLIICTSIPISVIGTFALLYFAGFTLNTMTFGGLALGIGMIVNASIVVLENTFRHMEHGKTRMQAAIDGSVKSPA